MSEEEKEAMGRVLRSTGGVYQVDVAGAMIECSLRGRLKRGVDPGRVAVGDEVELELLQSGDCAITEVQPRRSKLSRRSADGRREQIIAANIDQLVAVFAVKRPDPVYSLLDRFLVLAESSDMPTFIVANKIDLSGEAEAREQFGLYERIGYEVLYSSAKSGQNVGELGKRLAGRTSLLAGPSGAGKSTLLNELQPGLGLAVGEVSEALEKGRHTTVEASMHRLEVGGYVVDSPGLRRLRFWEVAEHDLGWCFPEFRERLDECRFPDCAHHQEPGCAVTAARAAGEVDERRYESYLRILDEQRQARPY